jgi:lysophospholipase L1-like esterase
VDQNRNGVLDPGEVRRTRGGLGFRDDPSRGVRNLAVPGEDSTSVFQEIDAEDIAGQLTNDDVSGRDVLKFLILGLPLRSDPVSQIRRARDLQPSFIMVWIGNNDVLDMATSTNPGATTGTAVAFGRRITMLLDALADTGAEMAVANLPDPTHIAALRRAAGEVTSCQVNAGGLVQPVAADDLLPIDLDRRSLPTPSCGDVLDAAERAHVRATVASYNAEIAAAIADVQARRGIGIAAVDVAARVDDLAANGVDVTGDGLPDLTTRYLGGIFSLDGIHPTKTGNALLANAFIDAINARFGEVIPQVDVVRAAAHDPLARSRFRPAGEPPFGLIGDSEEDDLEGFFPRIFARIERSAHDLRDDVDDAIDDLEDFFDRIDHLF